MSKFDEALKRVTEAMPVTPAQPGQAPTQPGQQPVQAGQQPKPTQPQAQQGQPNPTIQALAAAKTPEEIIKVLADPKNQTILSTLIKGG